jgi:hypothetical protein
MLQKAGGNSGVCAIPGCLVISIVTRDEGLNWLVEKTFFYEHPESSRYEKNKLQECAIIAVNFFCVRS